MHGSLGWEMQDKKIKATHIPPLWGIMESDQERATLYMLAYNGDMYGHRTTVVVDM